MKLQTMDGAAKWMLLSATTGLLFSAARTRIGNIVKLIKRKRGLVRHSIAKPDVSRDMSRTRHLYTKIPRELNFSHRVLEESELTESAAEING